MFAIPCFFFLVSGRIWSLCTIGACGGRFGWVVVWWVRVASQLTFPFLLRPSSGFACHTICGLLLFLLCASPVSLLSPKEKWLKEWDPFIAFVLLSLPCFIFPSCACLGHTLSSFMLVVHACGHNWLFGFGRLHGTHTFACASVLLFAPMEVDMWRGGAPRVCMHVCMWHVAFRCFVVCLFALPLALPRNILGFNTYVYVAGAVWVAYVVSVFCFSMLACCSPFCSFPSYHT